MADPQVFFSTLAQASAAVVGFVIAVSAALYSLERRRVDDRTAEYRDALTDLRNRYGFALETLAKILENAGGTADEELLDVTLKKYEIEELAHEKPGEFPVTTMFLTHAQRVLTMLRRIQPENDYILSKEELKVLEQSVEWYYEHFYQLDSTSDAFIKEQTGKSFEDFENGALERLFWRDHSAQDFHAFTLKRWFKKRDQLDSEIIRPDFEGREDDEEELVSGDNFWTLKTLAEYLATDIRKVSKESSGSIIRYEPGIQPVVELSTYLIVVGVVIPTLFLLSAPVTLPWWLTFLSQILVLVGTVALAVALIELVLRAVEPSSQMGDTENLSRYSATVVRAIPSIPFS